jgi:hypothetical protein
VKKHDRETERERERERERKHERDGKQKRKREGERKWEVRKEPNPMKLNVLKMPFFFLPMSVEERFQPNEW